MGAMATVVVPWFADRYRDGADWRALAWWIHDHLSYSQLQFFPKLAAFNIGWHERPRRRIDSFIAAKGCLTDREWPTTTVRMANSIPAFLGCERGRGLTANQIAPNPTADSDAGERGRRTPVAVATLASTRTT